MKINLNIISYWITAAIITIALISLIRNGSAWYYVAIAALVLALKLIFPFVRNKTMRWVIDLTITAAIIFGIVMLIINSFD